MNGRSDADERANLDAAALAQHPASPGQCDRLRPPMGVANGVQPLALRQRPLRRCKPAGGRRHLLVMPAGFLAALGLVTAPRRAARAGLLIVRPALATILLLASLLVTRPPAAAAGAPTLTAPADGVVLAGAPVFEWSAVDGTSLYSFQVSTDSSFSSTAIVYQIETANRIGTTPSWLADRSPGSPYYWRAGAKTGPATYDYSPPHSFSIDRRSLAGPALASPADGAELVVPVDALLLTWSAVEGADSYRVEVSSIETFTSPKTYTTKSTAVSIPASDVTELTTYWWRVAALRAVDRTTWQGQWSEARRFSKRWPSLPQPQAPADSFSPTIGDPFFTWSSVMGARDYQIQVSPNADWTNNVIFGGTETSPVWLRNPGAAPLQAIEDNQYYWRVRARDAGNIAGQWTAQGQADARKLQKAWLDAPVPLGPANDATAITPILRWQPVPGAAAYRLEISTSPDFVPSSGYYYELDTEQTEFAFRVYPGPEPPPRNTWLHWRVRALEHRTGFATPLLGPWSNNGVPWRFIYYMDAPIKLTSIGGEVVTTPFLSWTDVEGAATYVVTLWNASGIQVGTWETANLSLTPSQPITAGGQTSFSWTVYAKDAGKQPGPSSGNGTFQLAAPTGGALSLLSPADGLRAKLMPSFSWTAVSDAHAYAVFYRKVGETVWRWMVDDIDLVTPYTSYTPHTAFASDSYEWFVSALNRSGGVLASSPVRTFVVEDLDPVMFTAPVSGTVATTTPTLTWSVPRYSSFYRIVVAKDSIFNTIYHDGRESRDPEYRALGPAFAPRDSYPDTTAGQGYYWWIVPCRGPVNGGNCNRFDAASYPLAPSYSKRSPAVALSSPPHLSGVATTPSFTWQKANGVKQYRVQVSTDPNFATNYLVDNTLTDSTSYLAQTRNYPDGTLYWRVNAVDGSGNELTVSEVRQFTKISAAPGLTTPAPGAAASGTPYFTWRPVTDAVAYELQVSAQSTFGSSYDSATVEGGTGYVPLTKVYAPGTYYWRVRGRDASKNPMTWSAAGSFAVSLDVPTLLSPGASPEPSALLYRWTAVPNAVSYRVVVTGSAGTVFEQATVENSFWAPTKSYAAGEYTVRVFARDAAGNEGPPSSPLSFTIGSAVRPLVLPYRTGLPVTFDAVLTR